MFEYPSEEAKALHYKLIAETDGTEPCYDPKLFEEAAEPHVSHTDKWVEGWTQGATKAEAEALCAPCRVKGLCAAYAMVAKEPEGIWGGTIPSERK